MNYSNLSLVLSTLVLGTCLTLSAAQEPQAPVGNPPEPPAGAANGPQPGPAVKPAGPGERTTKTGQQTAEKPQVSRAAEFPAIGAPPDPQSVARGQALFVASCGFCHGSNATGGNAGPNLVRSVLVLHDKGTRGRDRSCDSERPSCERNA